MRFPDGTVIDLSKWLAMGFASADVLMGIAQMEHDLQTLPGVVADLEKEADKLQQALGDKQNELKAFEEKNAAAMEQAQRDIGKNDSRLEDLKENKNQLVNKANDLINAGKLDEAKKLVEEANACQKDMDNLQKKQSETKDKLDQLQGSKSVLRGEIRDKEDKLYDANSAKEHSKSTLESSQKAINTLSNLSKNEVAGIEGAADPFHAAVNKFDSSQP